MAASGSDEPTAEQRVWQVVAAIPVGRVASYGQVAELAGLPNGARRVGRILGRLPPGTTLPWHRVVSASGRIALPEDSGARAEQCRRLRDEGVEVRRGRIAMPHHRWSP
jgi:methylated-DNA-protein-cysteine methyltransferase-like protein